MIIWPEGFIFDNRFIETCGITYESVSPEHCEASLVVTESVLQPAGYLHGGATLALLETVASSAAAIRIDTKKEVSLGVEANIKHRKPALPESKITGSATIKLIEGNKIVWDVIATDEAGNTISQGTFTTKTVSLERMAQKEQADKA